MVTVRSKSMACKAVGNYLLFAHGKQRPTDAEWETTLQSFREAKNASAVRVLVFTAGAAPDTPQRAKLNDLLGDSKPRIAVLTSSPLARAAGTALRWFNPQFRIFRPDEVERALDHLQVPESDRTSLREEFAKLVAEVAPSALLKVAIG
jgi:hypothetical protein